MARAGLSPLIKAQLEKFAAMGSDAGAPSLPIIIPRKSPHSNISPPSSSSYTSTVDQMSSAVETPFLSRIESDEGNAALPTLASSCQRLEHSAARDRIAVKNQRRQPIREKLITLREIDDQLGEPFAEEPSAVVPHSEPRGAQLLDLSSLGSVRAALRAPVRPRDRSADTVLQTSHAEIPTSSVQRSISFKRPQELTQTKFVHRLAFTVNKKDIREDTPSDDEPMPSRSREQSLGKSPSPSTSDSHTSSQEHIYDNLDLFKRPPTKDIVSADDDSATSHQASSAASRLRPVSVLIPTETSKPSSNEFENVFNQLKKRASIRKVRPDLESPVSEEPARVPESIATKKPLETPAVSQPFNRRKTVGGVYLSANNKVATDEPKPTPSWIDIAKQKQTKFQSVTDEVEEPVPSMRSVKPTVSTGADPRSNRKSMFEPALTRPVSPPTTSPVVERDSIRALKSGNPNRINNLIQFFDK